MIRTALKHLCLWPVTCHLALVPVLDGLAVVRPLLGESDEVLKVSGWAFLMIQ